MRAALSLATTLLTAITLLNCGGAPTPPTPIPAPITQTNPAIAPITHLPTPTFTIILLSDLQPPTSTPLANPTTAPSPLANLATLQSLTPTPSTTTTVPLPTILAPAPTESSTRIPTSTATHTPVLTPTPTATQTPAPTLTPTIATTLAQIPANTATQTPTAPTPSETPTPNPSINPAPPAISASIPSETPASNPSETPTTPTPSTTPSPTPSETPTPASTTTPTPSAVPPNCRIKGNISSTGDRVYHTPNSPYYARTHIDPTQGERWFCTEQDAQAAGWRPPNATTRATPSATCDRIVHINTADAPALQTLPGIGETLAQRILNHRRAITTFTHPDQLTDIKGIGEKTLTKIRPCITLN